MKNKDVPLITESEDLIPTYASASAAGADIRADNDWAVKQAAANGHSKVVEYLQSNI